MPLSKWEPTPKILPSDTHRGEADPSTIYMAAGSTLSAWEHLEAGLNKFFQLMCETPSFAACRAYGVIESSYQRAAMLRAASTAFFAAKQPFDAEHDSDIKALLAAYENGQKYRNNIAHGVAVGFDLSNGVHSVYFLCVRPLILPRKWPRSTHTRSICWAQAIGIAQKDLLHYRERFVSLVSETMRLVHSVNGKHKVLASGQFHP